MEETEIRQSRPEDWPALAALYPAAFPDEDLLPLLRKLLRDGEPVLSLVAVVGSAVVGHGAFTTCGVSDGDEAVSLLAPLAVTPAWQRRGVGTAMVEAGLHQLREAGAGVLCVLGDPAYYGRFGFMPETGVAPPYPLPEVWLEAWQSIRLRDDVGRCRGVLRVPEPWRDPALWSPP